MGLKDPSHPGVAAESTAAVLRDLRWLLSARMPLDAPRMWVPTLFAMLCIDQLTAVGVANKAMKAIVVPDLRRRARCYRTHRQSPELWEFSVITCFFNPFSGAYGLRTRDPDNSLEFLAACFMCTCCEDRHIKPWGNLMNHHRLQEHRFRHPLLRRDHRWNNEQLIRRSVMARIPLPYDPDPMNAPQPIMADMAGLLKDMGAIRISP